MLDLIKKRVFRKTITRIIIAIAIGVVSLFVSNFAVLDLIKGPIKLGAEMKYEDYEGKYVTYDARCVLSEYVRVESQNTETKKSTLTDIGYFVFDEDNGVFLGIKLDSVNEKDMDDLMDDSLNYFSGYSTEEPKGITVTGTLRKLTGEELGYYNETVEYLFSEFPEYIPFAIPFTIEDNTVAGIANHLVYISIAVTIISLLYALYVTITFLTQKYATNIKKYLDNNPSYSMQHMESDFLAAEKISDDVWVGRQWTIHIEGTKACVVTNKELVWAYYYKRTGKHAESKIKAFNTKKSMKVINVSEKNAMKILDIYGNHHAQMVVGYDKELEKLYNKDFNSFLNIKYNAAATDETLL